jgi:hypothetical protein
MAMQCYTDSPQEQGTLGDILARARYTVGYKSAKDLLDSVSQPDTKSLAYSSTLLIVEALKEYDNVRAP